VAGAEASAEALAGRSAALLMVYSSLDEDFPGLVDAVRSTVGPGTPIIGCSTFGEISPAGAAVGSVVAIALGGEGFTARTAISRGAAGRQREAGAEVAEALGRTGRPHEVLLMIPDGLVGRQHEIVRGAYSVVGATIPLAGGCSGDPAYRKTYQFYGDHTGVEVVTGSVVAALIGSEGPIGVGMAHGWRACGEPMSLTSSQDTVILEFDHQPALDVLLRRIGKDPSTVTLDDEFMSALSTDYPLGLARRSGEDIRVVQSIDPVNRSMDCLADVQQGALVWLMEIDQESLVDGGRQSCLQAVANLGGAAPIGLIEFDCGVRGIKLGQDGVTEEVARMVEAASPAPVAGYYSMGEISRTRGARGMHHLTAVSLAFG
jgi:hypothetical protein